MGTPVMKIQTWLRKSKVIPRKRNRVLNLGRKVERVRTRRRRLVENISIEAAAKRTFFKAKVNTIQEAAKEEARLARLADVPVARATSI